MGLATAEDGSFFYRKPVRNPDGTIDCEVEHTMHGWIPFTASPDDVMEYGRKLYDQINADIPTSKDA